jgi:hypothetical protein
MNEAKIEFVSEAAPAYTLREDRIVARPGPKREVRPLEIHRSLFANFAERADEPESFADFMASFGPLTHDGNYEGERLDVLVGMRGWMAAVLKLAISDPINLLKMPGRQSPGQIKSFLRRAQVRAQTDAALPILSAEVTMRGILRPGPPDGHPILCALPDTLWDGMKLQLYQAINSGMPLKSCEWCGQWLQVGPIARTAKARFCSDNCRLRAHRHRKGGSK